MQELLDEAGLADAGFAGDGDHPRPANPVGPSGPGCRMVFLDQRAELFRAPHQRQIGKPLGKARAPRIMVRTPRCGIRGADARGQALHGRAGLRSDLSQGQPHSLVGLQSPLAVAEGEARLHQQRARDIVGWGLGQPARRGGGRLFRKAVVELEPGEPGVNEARPPAPGLALDVHPLVELGRVVQREALQKLAPIGLRGAPQTRTDRAAWRTVGGHLVRPHRFFGGPAGVGGRRPEEGGLHGVEVEPRVGPGPETQGFAFREKVRVFGGLAGLGERSP